MVARFVYVLWGVLVLRISGVRIELVEVDLLRGNSLFGLLCGSVGGVRTYRRQTYFADGKEIGLDKFCILESQGRLVVSK